MFESYRIRIWVYFKLIRIKFWLQKIVARKAILLKQRCTSLLDSEIRILKSEHLQLGEDERLDLVVEYVARRLTNRKILPELVSIAGDNHVADLLDAAKNSKKISQVVARYHATSAYLASLAKDIEKEYKHRSMAGIAQTDIAEYDSRAVYQEYKKTVERLRRLNRELAERSALKIQFSIETITKAIPLISAVFITAGFLQVHYFYSRMGVDASKYFSVSDYLAASVEQIRSGAFAASVVLFFFAFGIRGASLRSKLKIRAEATKRNLESWILVIITIFTSGFSAYSLFIGKPDFIQINTACMFIAYWIANYISAAFFKNQLVALAAILSTLIFGFNVGLSTYEHSELILNGKDKSTHTQQVQFNDANRNINGVLYGANSSYYFFYARDNRVTHVVPRDKIMQIDIVKKIP